MNNEKYKISMNKEQYTRFYFLARIPNQKSSSFDIKNGLLKRFHILLDGSTVQITF